MLPYMTILALGFAQKVFGFSFEMSTSKTVIFSIESQVGLGGTVGTTTPAAFSTTLNWTFVQVFHT